MRTKVKLVFGSLALFTVVAAGASAQSLSEDKARDHRHVRAERISSALPRIEKALKVRRDGTVALDVRRPAHQRLTEGERALGKALAHVLNGRIRSGELSVSQDLKVRRLSPVAGPQAELDGGFREADVSCDSHWWGEECDIDLATTQTIYTELSRGITLSALCAFFPTLAPGCALVDALLLAPAEEGFQTCADQGVGSEFNITWVGVPWITCQ